jgi:hypothetical protein
VAELIGDFHVRGRTYLRDDETGRFISQLRAGGVKATADLADNLAAAVRSAISAQTRRRSGQLIGSVHPFHVGQEGRVVVESDHAAPLEFGARDHWIPNAFGWGVAVYWRGSGKSKTGYHFVEDAVNILRQVAPAIMRKNMP